jgi:hypothetical protein
MMRITRNASLAPALLALVLVAGCDDALNVEAPGVVDAGELDRPQNAAFLVSGTISDFDCALGAYVVNQGLLGNELQDASVTASRFSLDARTLTETAPYGVNSCAGNPPGIYRPLATARWSADNALSSLDAWTDAEVPGRTGLIAQAAAYSGYSHLLLGEGFCSAVIEENGPEVQPQAAFEAAVLRFNRAAEAAQASGNAQVRAMALLGRARANLNLGNGCSGGGRCPRSAPGEPAVRDRGHGIFGLAPTLEPGGRRVLRRSHHGGPPLPGAHGGGRAGHPGRSGQHRHGGPRLADAGMAGHETWADAGLHPA